MYAPEPEASIGSAVVVVDVMSFRRAALMSLLESWAASLGLTLIAMEAMGMPDSRSCRMLILNIGGQPICEPDHLQWVKTIHEQDLAVPFVFISDREEPEEILRAFDVGAHGFIPTSTKPELALQALSFIIGGGSFFPPTALLSFASNAETPVKRPDYNLRKASLPSCHPGTLT